MLCGLEPLHTEWVSGRYPPIDVLALAEHQAAAYDVPIRDRQRLAKRSMNGGDAGQVTGPADAESAGLCRQLKKGQGNGAILFPPAIILRSTGHNDRGSRTQYPVI